MKKYSLILCFLCFSSLIHGQSIYKLDYEYKTSSYIYDEVITFDDLYALTELKGVSKTHDAYTIEESKNITYEDFKKNKGGTINIARDITKDKKNCAVDFKTFRLLTEPTTYRIDFIRGTPMNGLHLYHDSVPPMAWKLYDEFMNIDGMSCQKATIDFRCKEYVAWIHMDIPVQIGPWVFRNNPGLIVILELPGDNHYWKLRSFKQLTDSSWNERVLAAKASLEICNSYTRSEVKKMHDKFMKDNERLIDEDCLNCDKNLKINVRECFEDMD